MAEKRVVLDSYPGVELYAHIDDRTTHVKGFEHLEDTDGLLEMAKLYREHPPKVCESMRHAAVIPDHVLERAFREGWRKKDWARWANDPDNAHLRTWKGRI